MKIYENASLDNCTKLPERLVSYSKAWVKMRSPPSLVFYGSPGTGKTYLSIAIFRELCYLYSWVIWINSEKMDQELLERPFSVEKYSEVPILVWDDLGTERMTDRTARQYYSIINQRVDNQLPTIFTTNLSSESISQQFGDRIASRLNTCEWIEFPKSDLRIPNP